MAPESSGILLDNVADKGSICRTVSWIGSFTYIHSGQCMHLENKLKSETRKLCTERKINVIQSFKQGAEELRKSAIKLYLLL